MKRPGLCPGPERLETDAVAFAATLPPSKRALLAEHLARGGPLRQPRRGRLPGEAGE